MENVHKIRIDKVPNALSGRDTTDIEIFGMQGIPTDALLEREGGADAKRPRMDGFPGAPPGMMHPPPPMPFGYPPPPGGMPMMPGGYPPMPPPGYPPMPG